MTHEDELFDKIVRLESRLANYHDKLERALEHDREKQLDIAFGFVDYSAFFGAAFLFAWGARQILGELTGIALAVVILVAFIAGVAALVFAQKARAEQLQRMSQLPNWHEEGPRGSSLGQRG